MEISCYNTILLRVFINKQTTKKKLKYFRYLLLLLKYNILESSAKKKEETEKTNAFLHVYKLQHVTYIFIINCVRANDECDDVKYRR